MTVAIGLVFSLGLFFLSSSAQDEAANKSQTKSPYLIVLGIAQDGGVPQAGTKEHKGWRDDDFHRHVVCLAIVDPTTSERWMIDCTPDFPRQLHILDEVAPAEGRPGLSGMFLTHAHIGHYTGLVHLGHEVMGASDVPVHAMPRMFEYLSTNGPWDQLVRYKNIELYRLSDGSPVELNPRLSIEPFLVPHRQEYSEVVGYRITGPNRSVIYIPDIDSWEEWDEMGTRIENVVAESDVCYLDGTFYADGEIPGRDMSGFPHPMIAHTMERLGSLPPADRAKVRFLHLNHTNPALRPESDARKTIEKNGFAVAEELERVEL
ncbi:MAG: pyrroloquinoline quinone biosynthesis protein PqqB [Candidatus Latescibacterota bacterium]|nr:MAG: pyrroloquinoline quinone biosynthesis protein PqqB [Candidatus Latescibacterota bacterium]